MKLIYFAVEFLGIGHVAENTQYLYSASKTSRTIANEPDELDFRS
jgi:hypothetical protein